MVGVPMLKAERISRSGPKLSDAQTRNFEAIKYNLCDWIDELAPGQRKYRGANPKADPIPLEEKGQAVAELEPRSGTAAEVAARHGVSRAAPYVWRREIMGDNVGGSEEKGVPVSKGLDDLPDDIEVLQDMLREMKMQLRKVQLELDVRQAVFDSIQFTGLSTRNFRF